MDRRPWRVAPISWLLATTVAACSGGSAASPAPTTIQAVPTPAATPAPTQAPTPTAAPTTAADFVLVAFGDSIPGALNCPDGCTGYVELYGAEVEKALGEPIEVRNLARTDSFTAKRFFERMADPTYVQAARDADLLVIQIGFNDWQGPCTWANHVICLDDGRAQVDDYLGRAIVAIAAARGGTLPPMRLLTYYDNYVGFPDVAAQAWGFDQTEANLTAFTKAYGAALRDFNAMLCRLADEAEATCIDLLTAFNGPTGEQPATRLISNDGIHPSTAGHQRIADTLVAAGFADVVTPTP